MIIIEKDQVDDDHSKDAQLESDIENDSKYQLFMKGATEKFSDHFAEEMDEWYRGL